MLPTHKIRPNDTSRVPRRFLWLDTESVASKEPGRTVLTWRMGVTAFDGWDQYRKRPHPVEWRRHTTPASLWAYVASKAVTRNRIVVCGHNVGFDLRISEAFLHLPGLGFVPDRPYMSKTSTTVRFHRVDGASLVVIDSYSWLPTSLAEIGRMVGEVKLVDPDPGDEEGWWQRCTTDVNILRAAMLHLISWVEEADLGTWQPTGARQAWTTWRHRFFTHTPIVHDDAEVAAVEVKSAYTARCEAWKHGLLRGRRWVEMDLNLAFCNIYQTTWLPYRYRGWVKKPAGLTNWLPGPGRRRLYHATVTLTEPVLPARAEARILWPVGTFSGWWWDNELHAALEHMIECNVHEYLEYDARPFLQAFGDWCWGVLEGDQAAHTAIQRKAVKHWTRSLAGKFGAHYRSWTELASAPNDSIGLVNVWNSDERRLEKLMTCAGRAWWSDHEELGNNSMPAVMSAVMSECRIRLWKLMETAGLANIAYVDTDGLIVTVGGYRRLMEAAKHSDLWGVREKRSTSSLAVEGPRQIDWDGQTSWAGVPHAADRIGERKWRGERWQSMGQAFEDGNLSSVVVSATTWNVPGKDSRRVHLPNHRTEAVCLAG